MKIECIHCHTEIIVNKAFHDCSEETSGAIHHVFKIDTSCPKCKCTIVGTVEYFQRKDGAKTASDDSPLDGGSVTDYGVT